MEKKVVLVVEDEVGIRELIEMLLEQSYDVETVSADNGLEALRLAYERVPDLIFLDILLPGVDGLEIAKTPKGDRITAQIPIVAVSAAADRQTVLAAGCDDFIRKPFDVDVLLGKAQRYLLKRLAHC